MQAASTAARLTIRRAATRSDVLAAIAEGNKLHWSIADHEADVYIGSGSAFYVGELDGEPVAVRREMRCTDSPDSQFGATFPDSLAFPLPCCSGSPPRGTMRRLPGLPRRTRT
jgi:hypothetical protein